MGNIPCPSKAYDRVTDGQLMEHLGRRGRVQETKECKRPRSSPKAIVLSPGESVRIQDHKTLHWTKRAKVVKRKGPRTYVLKSGARTFIRNVRFIKRDPMAEDMEQTDFDHREVQGSNPADREVEDTSGTRERRPRVQGSNSAGREVKGTSSTLGRHPEVQGSNPAGREVEDTSSTQDRHPGVRGSRPTCGPTTRSRSRVRDHCQGHYRRK